MDKLRKIKTAKPFFIVIWIFVLFFAFAPLVSAVGHESPDSFTEGGGATKTVVALADTEGTQRSGTGEEEDVDDEVWATMFGEDFDPADRSGTNLFGRNIARALTAVTEFIWNWLGVQDPIMLIFQRDTRLTDSDHSYFTEPDDLIAYTFTRHEFQIIDRFYSTIRAVAPWLILAGAVIVAYFLMFSNVAESRGKAKNIFLGLVAAPALLFLGPYLMEPIFWFNRLLVEIAAHVMGDAVNRPWLSVFYHPDNIRLGYALLSIFMIIMAVILNFQYIVRKIMIAVLLIIFPVVAILAITPTTRPVLNIWVREMLSQVFMQAAHAFTYAIMVSLIFVSASNGAAQASATTFPPAYLAVATFIALNSITNVIRSLLGATSTESGGLVSSALGIGAVMALGRMAMTATGKGASQAAGKLTTGQKSETSSRGKAANSSGKEGGLGAPSGSSQSGSAQGTSILSHKTALGEEESASDDDSTGGADSTGDADSTESTVLPATATSPDEEGSPSKTFPEGGRVAERKQEQRDALRNRAVGAAKLGAIGAGAVIGGTYLGAAMGPAGLKAGALGGGYAGHSAGRAGGKAAERIDKTGQAFGSLREKAKSNNVSSRAQLHNDYGLDKYNINDKETLETLGDQASQDYGVSPSIGRGMIKHAASPEGSGLPFSVEGEHPSVIEAGVEKHEEIDQNYIASQEALEQHSAHYEAAEKEYELKKQQHAQGQIEPLEFNQQGEVYEQELLKKAELESNFAGAKVQKENKLEEVAKAMESRRSEITQIREEGAARQRREAQRKGGFHKGFSEQSEGFKKVD